MAYRVRRRVLIGLLVFPTLLLLADYLVWHVAEQRLRQGFSAWVDTQREHGWSIRTGTIGRGGWPVAATLDITDMAISGGDVQLPGGVAWRAEQLTLRVAPAQFRRLVVSADGHQSLRVGQFAELPFTAGRLAASLPLSADTDLSSAELSASQLRVEVPAAAGAGTMTVGSLSLQFGVQPAPAPDHAAFTYSLQADEIGMPPGQRWPLGPRIASLAMNGAITGPLTHNATLPLRMAAWRDGGGTLQVEGLAIRWGSLDLHAKATLTLDEQLQPMGAATMKMSGQAEALDAMAGDGVIKQQAAMAAKAILALMSRPAAQGEPATAELPLTLQNRTLAMGRIPLIRFPQLEWGTP